MILDLHRQGLSVSAIARQVGIDRKTVRKYIERGLEPPAYGPRKPRAAVIDPFAAYLRERVMAYPGLTGRRLFREIKERGYLGGNSRLIWARFVMHQNLPTVLRCHVAAREAIGGAPREILY
ncbi:MAG TPA: helix-turn-helix domain-containing protein, partial [Pedomonas sp.]|uniref:helix-turn-helix domain-containing protein n=1 Tax=Pedomonas sp. TaxID=2976421 RepID=UPI002F3FAC42